MKIFLCYRSVDLGYHGIKAFKTLTLAQEFQTNQNKLVMDQKPLYEKANDELLQLNPWSNPEFVSKHDAAIGADREKLLDEAFNPIEKAYEEFEARFHQYLVGTIDGIDEIELKD